MKKNEMKKMLAISRGDQAADILIQNIKILDLVNGDLIESAIALSDGYIAGVGAEYQKAFEVIDGKGAVVVPGFIDSHMHLESTLMTPFEFERVTLPLGTTAVICDPHEMSNVLGKDALKWYLRCSELTRQRQLVQISSCVPALDGFETNGAKLNLADLKRLRKHPNVLGLAEMMNFPGVIAGDDDVLCKLDAFSDMNLDGHCPMLTGKELNAYLAAGIQNCHETVTATEAKEKLQKGMAVIIREGSVAKNLCDLAPIINEFNSIQCMLCSDDRNPYEILSEGHVDHMIRKMIGDFAVAPHVAYRIASYSAAKHFGLRRMGLIAPGYCADFVLLGDYKKVAIDEVFIRGQQLSKISFNVEEKLTRTKAPKGNSVRRKKVTAALFNLDLKPGDYNVIGIIPGQLITDHLKIPYDGQHFSKDGVNKIAVLERYGKKEAPAIGLVKGFEIKKGAIASTVAHDAHNIIVIGDNDADMALAVNGLIESGGGFCVVAAGTISCLLPLPVAGLVSLENAQSIAQKLSNLKEGARKIGIPLDEPFLQMAFLALPVIPNLKITNKSLVDVSNFKMISLRA